MLQAAYHTCMDKDNLSAMGILPLTRILKEMSEISSRDDSRTVADTILYLSQLGISTLFVIGTVPDDRDPESLLVFISTPNHAGLPAKEQYLDGEIRSEYVTVISQVFSALHPNDQYYSSISEPLVRFEARLAAMLPLVEQRDDVEVTHRVSVLLHSLTGLPGISFCEVVKRCCRFHP
jgi:endothelin-converting enzyme